MKCVTGYLHKDLRFDAVPGSDSGSGLNQEKLFRVMRSTGAGLCQQNPSGSLQL